MLYTRILGGICNIFAVLELGTSIWSSHKIRQSDEEDGMSSFQGLGQGRFRLLIGLYIGYVSITEKCYMFYQQA